MYIYIYTYCYHLLSKTLSLISLKLYHYLCLSHSYHYWLAVELPPLKKMKVNRDDEIPNIWNKKNKWFKPPTKWVGSRNPKPSNSWAESLTVKLTRIPRCHSQSWWFVCSQGLAGWNAPEPPTEDGEYSSYEPFQQVHEDSVHPSSSWSHEDSVHPSSILDFSLPTKSRKKKQTNHTTFESSWAIPNN